MTSIPGARTILLSIVAATKRAIRVLRFNADNEYLQKKFITYRLQTSLTMVLLSLFGVSSWAFDNSIDPTTARTLLWARLAYLWVLFPAVTILRTNSSRLAGSLMLVVVALGQLQDLAILRQLHGGIAAATVGFVMYPLLIVIGGIGLSLFVNWAALLYVGALPLLLALIGWLPEFSLDLYVAAMLPTSIVMAFFSISSAWGYHRRYVLERALEDASNTDPLTGVANRQHFQVQLQRETSRCLRMARPCALLMLDIDHFKRINDTFGHPTGDLAIKAMADVCTENSRDIDVVARLGGEEFAILVPETSLEDAGRLAERIRAKVQDLKIVSESGEEVRWTVSVGIASLQLSGQNDLTSATIEGRLINSADAALYDAKNAGRNRVVARSESAYRPSSVI